MPTIPFDSSGNYTLPQTPFVTGTVISSGVTNSNFSDIASALTTVATEINSIVIPTVSINVYATIATAIAASISASITFVLVEGFTNPGDCDGQQMIFARGSSPTQGSFVSTDGATWILQNKNPHVNMFGAKGDGSTDDSTAILNAIAFVKTNSTRGGTIWFSAATYCTGTTITIGDGSAGVASSYNGITLASMVGVGASAIEFTADTQGTTLKWIGAANGTLVKFSGPIVSCGLTNICLHGNVTCSTVLNLIHSYKGTFQNVLVKKYSQNNATDVGIKLSSLATFAAVTITGDENTFINTQVEDAGNSTGKALLITGSNRNSFVRSTFGIPGTGTAIILQTCIFNTFTGCRITQQNTGTGVPINLDGTGAGCNDNTFIACELPAGLTTTASPAYNSINSHYDHGHVRLSRSGASTLNLAPYNGNGLLINGSVRVLLTAGVNLTLSGLTTATLYYVYTYWTGTTVALETSTTAYTMDTTFGVPIKTGDGTRSLVGMIYTTSTTDTTDTANQRLVASWFEAPERGLTSTGLSLVTTASAAPVELGNTTTNRAQWVNFANRGGWCAFSGIYSSDTAVNTLAAQLYFDGAVAGGSQMSTFIAADNVNGNFNFNSIGHIAITTDGFHHADPRGLIVGGGTGTFTGTIFGSVT